MLELPVELVNAISLALGGLITWAVVEGLKSLIEAFGGNLDGVLGKIVQSIAAVIAAGVVGTVIGVINILLGAVPPAWVPAVQTILALLVIIFGAMGIHRTRKLARQAHTTVVVLDNIEGEGQD